MLQGLRVAQPIAPEVRAAMAELSKERFRAHMAFLADDLLEGRGTASRGHEVAARYVAAQFEALGLKPAGTGGTFYQRVPLLEITVETGKCELTLVENGTSRRAQVGPRFHHVRQCRKADAEVEATVVLPDTESKSRAARTTTMAGVDVKGKIVAVLDGAPASLGSEMRAHTGSTREKMRIATEHGAVGMLVLRPPEAERILPWERWVIGVTFPSMRWIRRMASPATRSRGSSHARGCRKAVSERCSITPQKLARCA